MLWSGVMEQIFGALKEEKVSVAMIVVVVAGTFWMHSWASEKYVEKTEFQQLSKLMIDHTEEYRINNASQIIRDLKTNIRIAKATQAPEFDLDRLEEELEHAEQYKKCLVDRRPNCKHLRDVE
jgi:hypothetical protein